jgi:polyisoprenoid-binding protein YceI
MKYALAIAALAFPVLGAPALAENTVSEPAKPGATQWAIDPAHTHVGFSVPHMVVSDVDGEFKTFSGKVLLDEKAVQKSQLELSIEVASIDTGNADRDKHLRSPDFFDAQKYPQITFKSTKIVKVSKGYKITGDLTMRGVTKQVTLDATLSEAIANPWGKLVRAARISGKLSRKEFGVSWNKTLDKGGVVVGDQVTIAVKVELNK